MTPELLQALEEVQGRPARLARMVYSDYDDLDADTQARLRLVATTAARAIGDWRRGDREHPRTDYVHVVLVAECAPALTLAETRIIVRDLLGAL